MECVYLTRAQPQQQPQQPWSDYEHGLKEPWNESEYEIEPWVQPQPVQPSYSPRVPVPRSESKSKSVVFGYTPCYGGALTVTLAESSEARVWGSSANSTEQIKKMMSNRTITRGNDGYYALVFRSSGPETEDSIKLKYSVYGPIMNVRKDDRGFVFLRFEDELSATRCMEENPGMMVPKDRTKAERLASKPVSPQDRSAVAPVGPTRLPFKPPEPIVKKAVDVVIVNVPHDAKRGDIDELIRHLDPVEIGDFSWTDTTPNLRYVHVYFRSIKEAHIACLDLDNATFGGYRLLVTTAQALLSGGN